MFFPYSTDAPLRHFPYGTIGLIVVNVVAHILQWNLGDEFTNRWMLVHGDGLHPLQWVTSNFLHQGILHLLFNMVFLWVFGLVVEGKVGLGPFLAIYFGIGVTQCALEQVLFLGATEGSSLGASSILYGLMGIAMVWAPENAVDVLYFYWLILARGGTANLRIRTIGAIYLGLDLLWLVLFGLLGHWASSELLHLLGVLVGIPIGVMLLRSGFVDCEGWDWFSVRRGDPQRRVREANRRVREAGMRARAGAQGTQSGDESVTGDEVTGEWEIELELLRDHLRHGDAEAALETYRGYESRPGAPDLEESDLRLLILLFDATDTEQFQPRLLAEYHRRFPRGKRSLHLMYGRHLVEERRQPSKALGVLEGLDPALLIPSEAVERDRLIDRARRMIDDGVLELADE